LDPSHKSCDGFTGPEQLKIAGVVAGHTGHGDRGADRLDLLGHGWTPGCSRLEAQLAEDDDAAAVVELPAQDLAAEPIHLSPSEPQAPLAR